MRFWLLLIAYVACAIVAYLQVPSLEVFLTYGLPTWFGGLLFLALVRELGAGRRQQAASRVRSPYADRGVAEEPGQLRP